MQVKRRQLSSTQMIAPFAVPSRFIDAAFHFAAKYCMVQARRINQIWECIRWILSGWRMVRFVFAPACCKSKSMLTKRGCGLEGYGGTKTDATERERERDRESGYVELKGQIRSGLAEGAAGDWREVQMLALGEQQTFLRVTWHVAYAYARARHMARQPKRKIHVFVLFFRFASLFFIARCSSFLLLHLGGLFKSSQFTHIQSYWLVVY